MRLRAHRNLGRGGHGRPVRHHHPPSHGTVPLRDRCRLHAVGSSRWSGLLTSVVAGHVLVGRVSPVAAWRRWSLNQPARPRCRSTSTPSLDRVCGERESRVLTARIRMVSSPVAPSPTTVLIARADPFLFRPGIPCWTSGLYDRVVHAWNNPYPAYRLTRIVALPAPPQGGRAASPGRSPPPHLPLRTATPGPRCCCSRVGPG